MKILRAAAALLLLPLLVGLVRFLAVLLHAVAATQPPVMDIVCFALGLSTWITAHFALPRPQRAYIFGHEASHALAVWLSGGRVAAFHAGSESGRVETDRISTLIALAPYVLPFYPALLALLWVALGVAQPGLEAWTWAFCLLWGASWGFHASFTLTALSRGQSDLGVRGVFYSLTVIACGNLLLLIALLWLWRRPFGLREGLAQAGDFVLASYGFAWNLLCRAAAVFLP